jgi:DNA adenine methylase
LPPQFRFITLANLRNHSPLRYPGGKACLSHFITELAVLNGVHGGVYVELYAGGAGAALNMLFNGVFKSIHINDFDYHVYSLWYSILNHSEEFISRIAESEVSIDEWHRQQLIYKQGKSANIVDLGFSTFFLNRTNRSGIIFKAGPIGGIHQTGNYKIDVRFNKSDLIRRIQKIASYRDKIKLTNLDAVEIIQNLEAHHPAIEEIFLYLDPPYYKKGKFLYLNNYNHADHLRLSNAVSELEDVKWLISYDNTLEIKDMYENFRMSSFDLNYTLQSKKFGSELLVFSENLRICKNINVNSRSSELVLL